MNDVVKLYINRISLIISITITIFLFLSLATHHNSDFSWSYVTSDEKILNLCGYFGSIVSDVFICAFGYSAYLLPFLLAYIIFLQIKSMISKIEYNKKNNIVVFIFRALSFLMILISLSSLASLNLSFIRLRFGCGGLIGDFISNKLLSYFSLFGANLILISIFLLLPKKVNFHIRQQFRQFQ